MARSRNIKPGFFTNDELAEIEPLGRLLFAGLWTIADRDGRLEDRPKKIKIEILPYDSCDVDCLLEQLADRGFITRYVVDEQSFIQINNFAKHQNPHKNEKPSVIPQMPDNTGLASATDEAQDKHSTNTIQEQEKHSSTRADSFNLIPDSLNQNISLVPDSSVTTEESKKRSKYSFNQDHMELAEMLKYRILEHKPNFKAPGSLDQWANTIRLMIEQDHRGREEIAAVIDWCQRDSFWQINILSADKLRSKFDQLQLKMNQKNTPKQLNKTQQSIQRFMQRRCGNDSRESSGAGVQGIVKLPAGYEL